jgi:Tfp pilus assembly protein PilE
MVSWESKGQGESLIKLLVVAIIAIIALALAKSYFRETSRTTQKTVEEVFSVKTESFAGAPETNPVAAALNTGQVK